MPNILTQFRRAFLDGADCSGIYLAMIHDACKIIQLQMQNLMLLPRFQGIMASHLSKAPLVLADVGPSEAAFLGIQVHYRWDRWIHSSQRSIEPSLALSLE